MAGSAVCRFLAPVLRGSFLLRYENLFGALLAGMFLVPHRFWNNLWCVAIALLLLILCLARRGEDRPPDSPAVMGFAFWLFVFACLLSMLFTTAPGDSLRILTLFLGAFLLSWLIAVDFDSPASLRRLLGWLYLCLLAVSAFAVAQRAFNLVEVNALYTDLRLNKGVPGRVTGTLDNANNLSAFFQVLLPLGAAYALGAETPRRRGVLAAGLLLPAVALVMTYARAGWIAVALGTLVFLWFYDKRLIPPVLILGLLAIPILPQSVLTRLSTITNAKDTSRIHRLALWQGIRDMLRYYWVTGIGMGPATFRNVYPRYAYALAATGAYHSQMIYLELLVETGILGLVSFLWMVIKYLGRYLRAMGKTRNTTLRLTLAAGVAGFAALAVSGLVEYHWYYQRIIYAFFIFFGVAAAAARAAERENGGSAA